MSENNQKDQPAEFAQPIMNDLLQSLYGVLNDVRDTRSAGNNEEVESLNAFIKAEGALNTISDDFAGPSPRFNAPNWEGCDNPIRMSYKKQFTPVITDVFSTPTIKDTKSEVERELLENSIKELFESSANARKDANDPEKWGTTQDIIKWIGDTVISLDASEIIKEAIFDAMVSVDAVTNGTKANALRTNVQKSAYWTGSGTSTWESDFGTAVETALGGTDGDAAIKKNVDSVLTKLQASYKLLPLAPNGGPPASEQVIRNWIQQTISGMATAKSITPLQEDMLISDLSEKVTNMFPQPDKIAFYETFQSNLVNSVLELPPPESVTTASEVDGNFVPSTSVPNSSSSSSSTSSLSSQSSATSSSSAGAGAAAAAEDLGNGLKYWISQLVSPENLTNIAAELAASAGVANPLKANAAGLEKFSTSLSGALQKQLTNVVTEAVDNVFIALAGQGIQGRMLAAGYDYQLINRITQYTNTLLEQLDKHYDVDVPENGQLSLDAAQSITAAAVAMRQFSLSLDQVSSAYEDAKASDNSGRNSNVKTWIEGLGGSKDNLSNCSLKDISDYIYGSQSPEPLVLSAEYSAVQLAAESAGVSSTLTQVLLNERTEASNALNSLKQNTETMFTTSQASYKSLADNYYEALGNYTTTREEYQIDDAVNSALTAVVGGLQTVLVQGTTSYEAAVVNNKQTA